MDLKTIEIPNDVVKKLDTAENSFESDNPLDTGENEFIDHATLEKQFENSEVLASGEQSSFDIVETTEPVKEIKNVPVEGNNGHWSGEPGNSDWTPDNDYVPIGQHTNPEGKSWKELKEDYGFDKISFKDGEPNFSDVSKATVEINNFTEKRTGKGGNFDQADQKLMEQTGMTKPELIDYKKNHTWHEKSDCKTMELLPTDIHGNISHSGGVSEYKNNN